MKIATLLGNLIDLDNLQEIQSPQWPLNILLDEARFKLAAGHIIFNTEHITEVSEELILVDLDKDKRIKFIKLSKQMQ